MSNPLAQPVRRDGFVLFWGSYLSNWSLWSFTVDGVIYNCGEQWMMAQKARLFEDDEILKAIMAEPDPRKQKALGKNVRNRHKQKWTDNDIREWNSVARDRVYVGLLEKFRQNPQIKEWLLATENDIIVEASPHDKVWGIGLGVDDPNATEPQFWKGTNWLGEVLMRVRGTLSRDDVGKRLRAEQE